MLHSPSRAITKAPTTKTISPNHQETKIDVTAVAAKTIITIQMFWEYFMTHFLSSPHFIIIQRTNNKTPVRFYTISENAALFKTWYNHRDERR